jgi:hypothetical protein
MMGNFQSLTSNDLRDLLADLECAIGDGSERQDAKEALAWEVEEELHRRYLEEIES